MDTSGDLALALSHLWHWLSANKDWVFSGAGIVFLGVFVRWFRTRPPASNTGPLVTVENNSAAVAKAIEALSRELKEKSRKLEEESRKREEKEQALVDFQQAAQEREQSLRADVAAMKEALSAIPEQTEIPDAQARIKEALAAAADGNTTLAEAIFSEVQARMVTEGKAAYQQAAEAARHRGALAFLHDTDQAIAAYRCATELDPEHAEGWNRLGLLLYRTGALDETEAMYRKSLVINEELGHKAGIAGDYSNLGNLYDISRDLDQAEAMHEKALVLHEKLGSKEGMAGDYTNLGNIYQIRGDLDQAKAMYRKALGLFQDMGAGLRVEQVRKLLVDLGR